MDVKDLSPIDLSTQITVVPQTPVVFSMSACNNVRFGRPTAPHEEVVAAAQTANADGFIIQLKDGYNRHVQ
jgi:ATP-binding cassette subfamily B protein